MPDDPPGQDLAGVAEPGDPAGLRGRWCGGCAVTSCPEDGACPRCGRETSAVTLSAEGRLWTWTVQRFAPKSPPYIPPAEGFRPFAVGYVELPEGVRVAAVLDTDDLDSIRIGMPVRIGSAGEVPRAVPIEETP
ncbi:Zn-ribbon domain-containing OB-fold protein [Nonomuraea sp. NPDC049480]|uniref:Zn-ribbon domain-containing OB-fold protein n=1 Tax=Nonomuraea sp. NPDC049480 TaxID=3364353 RepID=UPI0037B46B32